MHCPGRLHMRCAAFPEVLSEGDGREARDVGSCGPDPQPMSPTACGSYFNIDGSTNANSDFDQTPLALETTVDYNVYCFAFSFAPFLVLTSVRLAIST